MMALDITYRWVDGPTASQEDWDRIEAICAARGWASLNRLTSRIIIAEDNGVMVGFHVFQLWPMVGPLFVSEDARGSGLAENLADKMYDFLADVQVRGFMVIAESRFAARLCEARGMQRVGEPVYVKLPAPSEDVIDGAEGQS